MSLQQDAFLRAIDAGADRHDAAVEHGIAPAEAKLILAALAKGALSTPDPLPAIGHNQPREEPMSESVSAEMLRLFIERVERLEEEKRGLADDIKDVYLEAKIQGFDTRAIRQLVSLRKLEKHVRDEREAILETYRIALGMDYASTPLGAATLERIAA